MLAAFNEAELRKIQKATSGFFKKRARRNVAQALTALDQKLQIAQTLTDEELDNYVQQLLVTVKNARQHWLAKGANSYGHPQWAAAAACESYLFALLGGDEDHLMDVMQIIAEICGDPYWEQRSAETVAQAARKALASLDDDSAER